MMLPAAVFAQSTNMNASITGGGGDGKCTIEADVDMTAEVVVIGTRANIRTLSGQTATLRRFQCNQPMPRNPANFRFRGIDGRGRQNLLGDPNGNGGRAIVRLDDPQGGREGYTFDLEWSGTSSSGYVPNDRYPGGYYPDDRNADGYDPYYNGNQNGNRNGNGQGNGNGNRNGNGNGNGNGNRRNSWTQAEAVSACQDEVRGRLERDGYRNVQLENGNVNDNPGNKDWISGTVMGRRGGFGSFGGGTRFRYECAVNLNNGRLKNVHVTPQ